MQTVRGSTYSEKCECEVLEQTLIYCLSQGDASLFLILREYSTQHVRKVLCKQFFQSSQCSFSPQFFPRISNIYYFFHLINNKNGHQKIKRICARETPESVRQKTLLKKYSKSIYSQNSKKNFPFLKPLVNLASITKTIQYLLFIICIFMVFINMN